MPVSDFNDEPHKPDKCEKDVAKSMFTARKIQCDGGLPACAKCARAQRVCQGYEMRLSWPREGDRRRSKRVDTALSVPKLSGQTEQTHTELFFVNTTWQEMEMYGYLSGQKHAGNLVQLLPPLWRQPQQQVSHMDLVQYCKL